jgi:hypothetical protein
MSFWIGLMGEPNLAPNGKRSRWIVADCFRTIAKSEKVPSMKRRMSYIAGQCEIGYRPSKKIITQIGSKRLQQAEALYNKSCNT